MQVMSFKNAITSKKRRIFRDFIFANRSLSLNSFLYNSVAAHWHNLQIDLACVVWMNTYLHSLVSFSASFGVAPHSATTVSHPLYGFWNLSVDVLARAFFPGPTADLPGLPFISTSLRVGAICETNKLH